MAEAPTTNYVPLRVRSNYSLLTGAATVEALVARAASLGLPALALTDEANLYGAVRFITAARAAGVHPVLGAILRGTAGADPPGEAVLLVQDREGYANLCRLITQRHLASNFRLAAAKIGRAHV
jgi:DNA polymerase-3 subunit alpha